MTLSYQEAIKTWNEFQTLIWTPDNVSDLQAEWETSILSLYKQEFRKSHRNYEKALVALKEKGYGEAVNVLYKECYSQVESRYNEFKKKKKELEDLLIEFSKTYTPAKLSTKYLIKNSESNNYRSQPSHNKYAYVALLEDKLLLELLGFEVEIQTVNSYTSTGNYSSYWEDYELWANLRNFDYGMLKYSGEFISVLNWAVMCWKNGTNPKVYFQFLSPDDYEKSQVLAYQTKYKITLENMKLEPSWDEVNAMRNK